MLELVRLTDYIPDLVSDMRYATAHNVTGDVISKESEPRLIPSAAVALAEIATKFRSQGYCLVVWDAYRTPETQKALRDFLDDERYVRTTSNHSTGTAIDLTLAVIDGPLLDMGTDHDNFSERSHANAAMLSSRQQYNRQLLAQGMEVGGHFKQWPYEWWHFDFIV